MSSLVDNISHRIFLLDWQPHTLVETAHCSGKTKDQSIANFCLIDRLMKNVRRELSFWDSPHKNVLLDCRKL